MDQYNSMVDYKKQLEISLRFSPAFKHVQKSTFFDEERWEIRPDTVADYATGKIMRVNKFDDCTVYESGAIEWLNMHYAINSPHLRGQMRAKTRNTLQPELMSNLPAKALRSPAGSKVIKKNIEVVNARAHKYLYTIKHENSGKVFPVGNKFTMLAPGAEPISDAVFLESIVTPETKAEWSEFEVLLDNTIAVMFARGQIENWDESPPSGVSHMYRENATMHYDRKYIRQYKDANSVAKADCLRGIEPSAENAKHAASKRFASLTDTFLNPAANTPMLYTMWCILGTFRSSAARSRTVSDFKSAHRKYFTGYRKHSHLLYLS